MKKLFLSLFILSLFSLIFTACSSPTGQPEKSSSSSTDSNGTTYKITYKTDYGTLKDNVLPANVEKLTDIFLPVPDFDDLNGGVEFMGWSTSKQIFTQVMPGFLLKGDITLYAFWNYKNINYCLDYNNPSEKKDNKKVRCIGYLLLTTDFTDVPLGYSFKGWNTKKDGSGISYANGDKYKPAKYTEETITFYAQWDIVEDYIITYDVNDYGKTPQSAKVKVGNNFTDELLAAPDTTETDGSKIFVGWYLNDSTKLLKAGDKILNDYTIHAVWETRTFKINFNSNNSINYTETKEYNVEERKSLSFMSSLYTEDGYKFDSWNTKPDGSGDKVSYSPTGMENFQEEITLYAIWKLKTYYVSFYYENKTSGDYTRLSSLDKINENKTTFTEFEDYTLEPAKIEGYIFEGWYRDETCILDPIKGWKAGEKKEDIKIYGKFIKRKGFATCDVTDIFVYDEDAIKIKYEYENIYSSDMNIKCNGQNVPAENLEAKFKYFVVSGLERGVTYNFELEVLGTNSGYEYDAENSNVTASLSIPTDCYVIPVEELSETVNALPENTVDTPYAICVARLNDGVSPRSESTLGIIFSKLYNTLSTEVKKIDGRYIDLRKTTLPAVESYYELFKNASRNSVSNEFIPVEEQGFKALVYAPAIPDGAIDLSYMFEGCLNLKKAPQMPDSAENLQFMFYDCINLESIPNFSKSAINMGWTCYNCSKLETVPELGACVETMKYTFQDCTSLTNAPDFSNVLTTATGTYGNTKITKLPALPEGCTEMDYICSNCKLLTIAESIPSTIKVITGAFKNCSKLNIIANWDVGEQMNVLTSKQIDYMGFATDVPVNSLQIYCDTQDEINKLDGFMHNDTVKYNAFNDVYVSAQLKSE